MSSPDSENVKEEGDAFPTVRWAQWECDASFVAGRRLPPVAQEDIYSVLGFLFYGDRMALADISGRGYCVPSGKVEPGETAYQAMVREAYEETGARLDADRLRPIGWYRLVSDRKKDAYCPVFIAETDGFGPIPEGSESRGVILAAVEDVSELYFMWDGLMAAVFEYADTMRVELLRPGLSMADFTAGA